MRRKKKLSLLVAFLFFHLPDLISTCCNLIKNYEKWGGGKKELLYNVDTRAYRFTRERKLYFFQRGARKSAKKKKRKMEKKGKIRSAESSPAFLFSQRMEITADIDRTVTNPSDYRPTIVFFALDLYRLDVKRRFTPRAV